MTLAALPANRRTAPVGGASPGPFALHELGTPLHRTLTRSPGVTSQRQVCVWGKSPPIMGCDPVVSASSRTLTSDDEFRWALLVLQPEIVIWWLVRGLGRGAD